MAEGKKSGQLRHSTCFQRASITCNAFPRDRSFVSETGGSSQPKSLFFFFSFFEEQTSGSSRYDLQTSVLFNCKAF
jgi:hypothetical protein